MSEPAIRPVSGSVTVVVATQDRPQALAALLGCLEAERRRISRLVVVDDGSTSEHAAAVEQVLDRVDWTEVRHTRRRQRGGGAVARNAGISMVETPRFLLVDDDCLTTKNLLSDALQTWDAIAGQDPHVVGLALPCLHNSTIPRPVRDAKIGQIDWSAGATHGNFDVLLPDAQECVPVDYLNGVALLSTEAALACGGFIDMYPEWPAAVSDYLFFSTALSRRGGTLYFANQADRSFAVHLKFGARGIAAGQLDSYRFALDPHQLAAVAEAAQVTGHQSGHRVAQEQMAEEIMGGITSFFLAHSPDAAFACMSRFWREFVLASGGIGRYSGDPPADPYQRLTTWLAAMTRAEIWTKGWTGYAETLEM